ncbi:NAD(P)/FAD-dependent oxidoreductase [Streptomyces sp. NBC_01217]|uniref:NAD(P)/FAD-dependent oxidoreductase n=1 Tax=Streptomyces sp. NBC_01217 TaxID=2903779 RepID=UPI002E117322|nr:FAD-dependent oxidoreductase [Streptomyces sp. NBC_01217]
MRHVVVVGASAAGLAAVETLRREGYAGTITLIGDEPHPPYDRPPLSKQILSGQWNPDRMPLRPLADLDALDIDLLLGTAATELDLAGRTVALSDGARVPYDGLIIATGVRPRRLPGAGATGTHVLRTLDDALVLRGRLGPGRRLVVVGSGFLGTEVAAVARELGTEVTLLEPARVPLASAVGERIGRVLSRVHQNHGVDLRTGVTVAEVADGGVWLADGTFIKADEVLVAIGSVPNTAWLEDSGLSLSDGLVCDEYSAAAPGVYGAGDVARWHNPLFGTAMRIEHRTNATEQGMAAARNLLHPDAQKPFAPIPYFWSDQYDLRLQAHGYLRGHEEVAVVEGDLEEHKFLAIYRSGDRVVGALGVGMPPKAMRTWRQKVATQAAWRDTAREPTGA